MLGDTPASYYFDFDASGPRLVVPSGVELDCESGSTLTIAGTLTATDKIDSVHYAATSIDKEHLATEIYTIEPITIAGTFDNETFVVYRCWSACTVVGVLYDTSQLIGTTSGIDIVDGGSAGAGTDVIDSCSDNLNGIDYNALTTPYALSAGDYVNVTFDDLTASTRIAVTILLKVPVGAAT